MLPSRVSLALALAAGCQPAPGGGARGPAETPSDSGLHPDCLEPNTPTWDTWGEGFFVTWCQSCHSRTTPQRAGAPAGVDFDHAGDVRQQAAAIRRTVLDAQSMPLGGGLDEQDRADLDLLLRCGP